VARFKSPIQVFPPDGNGPLGDRWTVRNVESSEIITDTKTEALAIAAAKECRAFRNARNQAMREIHSKPSCSIFRAR